MGNRHRTYQEYRQKQKRDDRRAAKLAKREAKKRAFFDTRKDRT